METKHCSICGPVDGTTTVVVENGVKLSYCNTCYMSKQNAAESVQETRTFLAESPVTI